MWVNPPYTEIMEAATRPSPLTVLNFLVTLLLAEKSAPPLYHANSIYIPLLSYLILTRQFNRIIKRRKRYLGKLIKMMMRFCLALVLLCNLGMLLGASAQGDIGSLISEPLFEEILKHRNDPSCPANGFYTYQAFIDAANSFGTFGTTGDTDTRKREIAAFLAQTSHETTGGWATAPDGAYAWGYCFKEEQGNPPDYCVPNQEWPCAPNKKYYGRGPIQISYNYNYGPAGSAIGSDLLNNPDLVATDPTISFKTALWFWTTPQPPKPSSHDVITGQWTPSPEDSSAGRVPGYGVVTNIINGGIECGKGPNPQVEDRIGFYSRYCTILGVSPGENLDCYNQRPFA